MRNSSLWFWLIGQVVVVLSLYTFLFRGGGKPDKLCVETSSKYEASIFSVSHSEPKSPFAKSDKIPPLKQVTFRKNATLTLKEKKHDKWIIVTSIQYPTDCIKMLASLKGWKTLIVGDTKTPKDWAYPGVTYLSVEAQKELGYQIVDLLPYRSYARKNIGYLYAIQHGATVIYETDDDNSPNTNEIYYLPERHNILMYEGNKVSLNVYKHFGQPTIWPRGFPLKEIRSTIPETASTEREVNIPVQQALANLDPDVDAIFRLSRGLNITFTKSPPIALPHGSFCPYNTQNTIYFKSAFWGLLVPITPSFRVCDIWRSYWAQRLLWDIGAHLAFLHATVDQVRNPHDYLIDFEDELALYLDAGKYVDFLREWESDAPRLTDRMMKLMHDLVVAKFFGVKDLDLMAAWVQDLLNIGYEFPPVVPMNTTNQKLKDK